MSPKWADIVLLSRVF